MISVTVNSDRKIELNRKGNDLFTEDGLLSGDVVKVSATEYHIIRNHKSYRIHVLDLNRDEKTCRLKINGQLYTFALEDEHDRLLKQLGFDKLASGKVADIKAPMPGLVLKVLVNQGDEVKKGDNLLVLEAMKMENILKSPVDGHIHTIKVSASDKVEKNQVMITFQ